MLSAQELGSLLVGLVQIKFWIFELGFVQYATIDWVVSATSKDHPIFSELFTQSAMPPCRSLHVHPPYPPARDGAWGGGRLNTHAYAQTMYETIPIQDKLAFFCLLSCNKEDTAGSMGARGDGQNTHLNPRLASDENRGTWSVEACSTFSPCSFGQVTLLPCLREVSSLVFLEGPTGQKSSENVFRTAHSRGHAGPNGLVSCAAQGTVTFPIRRNQETPAATSTSDIGLYQLLVTPHP